MSNFTTGRKTDTQGRPLFLRDSHIAAKNFGLTDVRPNLPKSKFLFYVRFIRNNANFASGGTSYAETDKSYKSSNPDLEAVPALMVKSVDRPSMTFKNQTLNQYGKKRIIQTQVEYEPVTIRFHDTIDNRVFSMFEEYFRYYYGDPRQLGSNAWLYDITNETFFEGPGWGFSPPANIPPNSINFFSQVEIYQFLSGGAYISTVLVNPKIRSFDQDELDYSNGSVGMELTLKLDCEGVLLSNGVSTVTPSLADDIGLTTSEYFEPFDGEIVDSKFYNAMKGAQVRPERFSLNNLFSSSSKATTDELFNSLIRGEKPSIGKIAGKNFQYALNSELNLSGGNANLLARSNNLTTGLARSTLYNLKNTGKIVQEGDYDRNGNKISDQTKRRPLVEWI